MRFKDDSDYAKNSKIQDGILLSEPLENGNHFNVFSSDTNEIMVSLSVVSLWAGSFSA